MREQQEDDQLTGALAQAASMLRAEPVPRAGWREALLEAVASDEIDQMPLHRWSVRPAAAIAACAACVIAGAALSYGVLRGPAGAPAPGVAASSVRNGDASLPVRFALEAPGAVHVSIVGDFNGWNPAGLPLHRMPDGRTWEVEVGLTPGRYAYAFVVDGRLARDSSAAESGADDFGVPNSVVLVGGS
jgi:hypothetical protein